MKSFSLILGLAAVLFAVQPAFAERDGHDCPISRADICNHQMVPTPEVPPSGEPTPIPAAVSAPTRTGVTPRTTTTGASGSTGGGDHRIAVCHSDDSQKGMDSANGVQSVQPRMVQPFSVSKYLRNGDWLPVPGGDCGAIVL